MKTVIKIFMNLVFNLSVAILVFSCLIQQKNKPFILFNMDEISIVDLGEEGKYFNKENFDDNTVFSIGFYSLGTTDKFTVENKRINQRELSDNMLSEIEFNEIEDLYKLYKSKIDAARRDYNLKFSESFTVIDTLNLVEINSKKEIFIYSVIWETNIAEME